MLLAVPQPLPHVIPRPPTPTWAFAITIVRRDNRFLLVQEDKPGQPWYFPAGLVELGEGFPQAAVRETLEEAGVSVRLNGILKMVHTPRDDSSRLRVVFVAEPVGDPTPKSIPDEHSLQARWVSSVELDDYLLRGESVRQLIRELEQGCPVFPLSVLETEHIRE
ncbi:MAG: NUDIX domain-containing protein [Planctomycetaceae bacterium]|jgi:phosphatase NudJ